MTQFWRVVDPFFSISNGQYCTYSRVLDPTSSCSTSTLYHKVHDLSEFCVRRQSTRYHSVSHWEKGQKCKANFVLAHSAFPEFYIQSCDSGILLPWDAIKDVACGISEQIITDHSSIGHKIKAITCKICNKAPRTIYKHVTIRFCASTDESLNSQRVLYVRVGISNATSSHGANRRKFSHCGINISWQEHRHKLSSSQSVSPLFFFFWGGILVYCPLELRPIVLSRDGGSAVE